MIVEPLPMAVARQAAPSHLPVLPTHWEKLRLRRVFNLVTEKRGICGFKVGLENISSWTGRYVSTDAEFEGEGTSFRPGDILFGKLRPYLAKALLADRQGEAVGDFHVLRPIRGVNGRYCLYQMLEQGFISVVDGSTFGAKMPRVSWEFMANLEFALPPIREQDQIVHFLDRETAKIDELIAKQERLIALLEEKRQAVISRAVTKGLCPIAPLKETGVVWLGSVPAHWAVCSLGYVATIKTGSTPDRDRPHYWGGGIPWVKTGEIKYDLIEETEETISELGLTHSAAKLAKSGTLLMAMYGQGATRGRVAILGIDATYNQACAAIESTRLLSTDFLRYFFIAGYPYIRDDGNETSQMNLSSSYIAKIKVCKPPYVEQEEIVNYLDEAVRKIDGLISRTNSLVVLMRERRSALISAAVTGKIDVREMAA